MSKPVEPLGQRVRRVIIPGTTGGFYTLTLGALGFLTVLGVYVHSYVTGRAMPDLSGELLAGSLVALGVHQVRGISADRVNAANGLAPVPIDPTAPAQPTPGPLPDLRPTD
ncbi:hypothetical protein GO986_19715 [Deinococcus sp. HMF7620]|uniref:Uncharacterized protein n=1 Tax=Deinococcus arboris TaxID=2682977 RepID=A0A7C9HTZ9_9DEIO|nr:hypothetical protein [Deinococcus arboris]MVN88972.1 hypothetical protein [Deinococcus arboris]